MSAKLTQEQWFEQIKGAIPSWVFQKEKSAYATFMALAKVCESLQYRMQDHLDDTFITSATSTVLNTHGAERTIPRLTEELDPSYRVRVRNLFNQSNPQALADFINGILVAGTARIQEDFNSVVFASREFFCNRAAVFLDDPIHNTFSIVVDKQIHEPYSFASREYFCDREGFAGTFVSLDEVFDLILQIVSDNKALGTFFRIIELLE